MKTVLLAVTAFALSACTVDRHAVVSAGATAADTVGIAPPSTVADKTVLDEEVGLGLTTAYRGAVALARVANRAKPFSPALKVRVAELDSKAFKAVAAVRTAYEAGNQDSYTAAAKTARGLIDEIIALAGGAS